MLLIVTAVCFMAVKVTTPPEYVKEKQLMRQIAAAELDVFVRIRQLHLVDQAMFNWVIAKETQMKRLSIRRTQIRATMLNPQLEEKSGTAIDPGHSQVLKIEEQIQQIKTSLAEAKRAYARDNLDLLNDTAYMDSVERLSKLVDYHDQMRAKHADYYDSPKAKWYPLIHRTASLASIILVCLSLLMTIAVIVSIFTKDELSPSTKENKP